MVSGRGIFATDSEETEVGPGDVVYIYSNELHTGRLISGAREPLEFLCCIECVDGGENCTPEGKGLIIES